MSSLLGIGGQALAFLLLWVAATAAFMIASDSICAECPPATDLPFVFGGAGMLVAGIVFGAWKILRRGRSEAADRGAEPSA